MFVLKYWHNQYYISILADTDVHNLNNLSFVKIVRKRCYRNCFCFRIPVKIPFSDPLRFLGKIPKKNAESKKMQKLKNAENKNAEFKNVENWRQAPVPVG